MVSDQNLLQLHQIRETMDLMDRRVQCTEDALEKDSSHVSLLPTTFQGHFVHNMVSNGTATEPNFALNVISSIYYLMRE